MIDVLQWYELRLCTEVSDDVLHAEGASDGDHNHSLGEVNTDEEGGFSNINMKSSIHNFNLFISQNLKMSLFSCGGINLIIVSTWHNEIYIYLFHCCKVAVAAVIIHNNVARVVSSSMSSTTTTWRTTTELGQRLTDTLGLVVEDVHWPPVGGNSIVHVVHRIKKHTAGKTLQLVWFIKYLGTIPPPLCHSMYFKSNF